jgi:multicomponent Na+:H+ antiporter subunit G
VILVIYDILTIFFLLFGMFFLLVGVVGVYRLPDVYGRMHAGSKCITLGISGLLIAVIFHLAGREGTALFAVATKAVLVIVFQFVASPVGAHLLSRAAHLDRAKMYAGTLSDDLTTDVRSKEQVPQEPEGRNG